MVNNGRLFINYEDCLSCAACPPVCHTGALNLTGLLLELKEELCDNCSLCTNVCPTGALRLIENMPIDPETKTH